MPRHVPVADGLRGAGQQPAHTSDTPASRLIRRRFTRCILSVFVQEADEMANDSSIEDGPASGCDAEQASEDQKECPPQPIGAASIGAGVVERRFFHDPMLPEKLA